MRNAQMMPLEAPLALTEGVAPGKTYRREAMEAYFARRPPAWKAR